MTLQQSFLLASVANNLNLIAWVADIHKKDADTPAMSQKLRRTDALIAGLSTGTELSEAKDALRAMIDRIVLTPSPDGEGLVVDIEGALAGLLRLATGLPVGQKAPSAVLQGADIADELVLVAGVGFEPTTFRL